MGLPPLVIVTGLASGFLLENWWMNCGFIPTGQGYCMPPKGQLEGIAVLRYAISVVSILVTSLSGYIVARTKSITRDYRTMLVISLAVWLLVDILVQVLGDPFLLFPTSCVYHRVQTSAQLTSLAGLALVQSLVMVGVVIYFALFIYRHQKITPPDSLVKLSLKVRSVFLFVILIIYAGVGPLFYSECAPIASTLRYLPSNEWAGTTRERIDFFPLTIINHSLLMFNGVFACIFVSAIASKTFAQIRDAKNISPTMQRLHRVLTWSLIFQSLTPIFLILIPIATAAIAMFVLSHGESVLTKKPVFPFTLAMVLFSCHATVHAVVLIGTTPAFREKLRQMIPSLIPRRVASQRQRSSVVQPNNPSFTRSTTR